MIERKEKNQTSSAYSFTKKIGLLFKTKFHFAWKCLNLKMLWEAISFSILYFLLTTY